MSNSLRHQEARRVRAKNKEKQTNSPSWGWENGFHFMHTKVQRRRISAKFSSTPIQLLPASDILSFDELMALRRKPLFTRIVRWVKSLFSKIWVRRS